MQGTGSKKLTGVGDDAGADVDSDATGAPVPAPDDGQHMTPCSCLAVKLHCGEASLPAPSTTENACAEGLLLEVHAEDDHTRVVESEHGSDALVETCNWASVHSCAPCAAHVDTASEYKALALHGCGTNLPPAGAGVVDPPTGAAVVVCVPAAGCCVVDADTGDATGDDVSEPPPVLQHTISFCALARRAHCGFLSGPAPNATMRAGADAFLGLVHVSEVHTRTVLTQASLDDASSAAVHSVFDCDAQYASAASNDTVSPLHGELNVTASAWEASSSGAMASAVAARSLMGAQRVCGGRRASMLLRRFCGAKDFSTIGG